MFFALKRAALVAALCILSPFVKAQEIKSLNSETYKDIIEKSYNLSLQKDRQQALNILSSAISKETRPQAIIELKRTVAEISTLFLSDKAQQLFESGISLKKNELNQALDKMSEASRIESDNFLIVNEMSRILIAKGDCRTALELIQKHLAIVKFDEDLKLSQAQAFACQNKWTEFQKVYDSVAVKKSPHYKFWLALEVERHIHAKGVIKAQESLQALKKIDEKYPELFYWTWRLGVLQKKSDSGSAQKYVMSCKNISANQYRQYMIDPMLCRHVNEVEGEIKGIYGSAEER